MPQAVLLDAQEQAAKDVAAVPVPRHTDGVRHALRVFTTLVGLRYKARLMYPAAYYSFLAAKLVGYISEYAVIWLLLERFKTIAGWTLPEVLLLHSINVISYTIAASFVFHIARNIEQYVVSGELDTVLLKPVHPLVWLSGYFYSPTYVSQTILGFLVLSFAAGQLDLHWSLGVVVRLGVVLLGASFLQAALFLVASSVTFWTVRGRNIADALLSLRDLVSFPLSIYGVGIRFLLTFVIPVAFINYYPAGILLDRPEYTNVAPLGTFPIMRGKRAAECGRPGHLRGRWRPRRAVVGWASGHGGGP
ncbi:MAG: ABC-2 family transporter protein [Chloroflexi bacterium]|nr:ABC-2 family transporter protein [Chloroflexota bacterium]